MLNPSTRPDTNLEGPRARSSGLVSVSAEPAEIVESDSRDIPRWRQVILPPASVQRTVGMVRTWSPRLISFILVVIVPILAVAFYTLAWATPRFASEFRAVIRTTEPMRSAGLPEVFGIVGMSQSTTDANSVVQYIHSRDAVEAVEKRFPLRQAVTEDSIDIFSRFLGRPEIEALTRYWNKMADAYYEASTGTIIVRVTAFTPRDALTLARLLLEDSENLVNRMSRRVREDSVAFAEGEVAKAEARLSEVRRRYQLLQDKESMLDPQMTAAANINLASKIREQIAQRSAELATIKGRLAPNAPSVRAMEETIAALRLELDRVEAQSTAAGAVAGSTTERPLSSVFGVFQQIGDERAFAEKAYLSALGSLEAARMDAARQQVYLAVIVPPALPEEADFPRPIRQILMTAVIALCLWLIGLLTAYSVREHM